MAAPKMYGFWRPYLKKVIDRYLECGDLHHGFARVKCRVVIMNISWLSPASAVISVPPAIRNGWWNSGNGSAPACSRRFPTGISSSASRRSCAFIEDREVIKAILKHLGLWLVKSKPSPKAHAPPPRNQSESGQVGYFLDHFCQLSLNDDHLHRNPDYSWEAYLLS